MAFTYSRLAAMGQELAMDPESLTCLAGGAEVARFEQAFAEVAGHVYALGCANGTGALHIALLASDIGAGDEVIVAAYGWPQTVTAVLATGATPVFADVSGMSGTLDPAAVESMVGPRTRAILVTHLFGNPADLRGLRAVAERHGLVLVADACQALGARYDDRPVGSLADISAYSLGCGKIVSTGEGGMVTTSRRKLYERMLLVSQHPLRARAELTNPELLIAMGSWSLTSRITRLTAAAGLAQIATVPARLAARRQDLARLRKALGTLSDAVVLDAEDSGISAAHDLVAAAARPDGRDGLIEALACHGFAAAAGPVGVALHLRLGPADSWWPRLLDPRRGVGFGKIGHCPVAESLCTREICVSVVEHRTGQVQKMHRRMR